MSKNLNNIRVKIDAIDNQLHDLLMERAALVSSVAAAKKKDGLQIVQPAREAKMMRRLLSRHSGVLPKSTIVRIWRELVGAVALLQTGLSVVVAPKSNGWDAAKNYFGSVTPMSKSIDDKHAIMQVRDGKVSFAVLPFPNIDNEENPWWDCLFNHDNKLSIICALPYGMMGAEKSVVVSEIAFMPSDDDISFIGVKLSSEISRTSITDITKSAGFDVINVFSSAPADNKEGGIYLLEVKGFAKDLTLLKDTLGDTCLYCSSVGGYPVIPDIS